MVVVVGVGPKLSGARRKRSEPWMRASARGGDVRLVAIEPPQDDLLDAMHVDELEAERAATGRLQGGNAVAVDEAEELLGLAQLGPGERPVEKPRHEGAEVGAVAPRPVDQGLRVSHGVGRLLGGIVGIVGVPPPGRLGRTGLDELAAVVDADELRVTADVDRVPQIAMRHGVEGLAEADVMVRVDLDLGPARRVEALALERP